MTDETAAPELELRDYLRVLRRRKGTIALAVLIVVGAALVAAALQTPVYQSSAQILLRTQDAQTLFNPNTGQANDPTRAMQTEIQIVTSQPVRQAVKTKLGTAPRISATPVGQTNVMELKANSTDPATAALVANTYAQAYIDFRRSQGVNDLLAAASQIQTKIADLQHQIDAINSQIDAAPPFGQAAVRAQVTPQLDSLIQQQSAYRQQQGNLEVQANLDTGGAELVTPAATSTSPVRPRPKRDAAIAIAVGLILGVGLAFLLEYLDDSLKSKEDVERVAPTVPVLGLVPAVPGWKPKDEPVVVAATDPRSPAAESYRSLRTALQFMALDRPMRTLQVTSPTAQEGKSTTLANLGVALAQAGQRVVIVCCDLRRPRIHEFFRLDNGVGFTSVLVGETPLAAALQQVDSVPGLQLMASGPMPPNPAELLASRRTVEVITALQAEGDIVLLDCPPVLPVTDAAVLSGRVDATLVVASSGETTRKELSRALEVLGHVDAPVVGLVLNGVSAEGGYGYAYHYRYYGSDREPSGIRPRA